MSTTKEYKNYVLEKLECLDSIFCRPMMGGYLFYYRDILFGGIYENDNFLIKKTSSNEKYHLMEELLRNIIIDTCKDLKPKKGK